VGVAGGAAVLVGIGVAWLLPRWLAKDARRVRGLRVDPAFFYEEPYLVAGQVDGASAAELVAQAAAASEANTLFVRAYDPRFGAYYPTDYRDAAVEGRLGREGVLHALVEAAGRHGLRVVAWLPVNDFAAAWEAHPDWRSKRADGSDYRPDEALHLLSAGHPEVRTWYEGLVRDLLAREPGLHGVEAAEAVVDVKWDGAADYNSAARIARPADASPEALAAWKAARAEDLTAMHRALARAAHDAGREAHIVQTWAVGPSCQDTLLPSAAIRDGTGFDFDGILAAPPAERPDVVAGELIWQQWRDQCGPAFDPAWTERAATELVARIGDRAEAVVHVEATPFGHATPTAADVTAAMTAAWRAGAGLDVYDDRQLRKMLLLGVNGAYARVVQPWRERIATWLAHQGVVGRRLSAWFKAFQ
jgi:hypothetical protein